MYSKKICQVSSLISFRLKFIISVLLIVNVKAYTIPEPLFEVLGSKGLRISIQDTPGLQYFTFHGNLNKPIRSRDPGELFGDVFRAKNGRWTLEKGNVILQEGDIINYWIYVQVNNTNSIKENQRYVVRSKSNLEKSTTPASVIVSSNTEKGQLIFSEDFNNLNESLWSRDIKMPLGPDYEFCIYHNDNHPKLVEIDDGILRIKPIILEDSYGENITSYGTLQLADCTSNIPQECSRNAISYNILPPVISARFNTKNRFAFKYGKIEIRAKFPEGDWLYPELWLEPLYSLYGPNYASGRVVLGFARGNDNLVDAEDLEKVYDSRKLEFGLKSGSPTIYEENVHKIVNRDSEWNKDFHVYTTIWDANGFKFLADGEEIGRLLPTVNGWLHNDNTNIRGMTKIAPFDQEFYISIGVGVGGLRVFPDKTISSGYKKPWKNVGAKPMLEFWHARNQWLPSWRRDNSNKRALEIDYVKVWSL
ncbi:beta-1,3-glucan-binding protein-like isoform X1 [Vespa crabro]|uniref:beta-1,3-glucan-binding protein-like isoform X1 n=1 Tax=Vespa crabro TaxID=7445 RepID=UPI001F01D7ED|nr:beta-1,3-glucan-binding protein-like isoform X1 [Vespa crabro]